VDEIKTFILFYTPAFGLSALDFHFSKKIDPARAGHYSK
jgi:hypothetical protein